MEELYRYFAAILGVDPGVLEKVDAQMQGRIGKNKALLRLRELNETHIHRFLPDLLPQRRNAEQVIAHVRRSVHEDEQELLDLVSTVRGKNQFEKAALLAQRMVKQKKGFFLKKEKGEEILRKRPPQNLLNFVGVDSVEKLLAKVDVAEAFSALRFIETQEWMHETFDAAYSEFTAEDFEERNIEIKVLGPEWKEVAKKFVAKKHHNVSHLKEFGVIFLNPIQEDAPGTFLRYFALLLHYVHEVNFYAKLFKRYVGRHDFSARLKSLLRGDVKEGDILNPRQWLIVQRYLWKENPQDPRLFLPRINPESLHWRRAERDIANYRAKKAPHFDLKIWKNTDWVALAIDKQVISFDLEDNVMSFVSLHEKGRHEAFSYHQREALWTRIFMEYVGGEKALEKLLIDNFERGFIEI
ncbi:MAG: hypothetical protein Q8P45_03075 [Candidatus Harrisonbacteria bacterium]|nr:hypothetical protein [Candidatus Harrisonbacteria bacterium]